MTLLTSPEPGVLQLFVRLLEADEGVADGVEPGGAGFVKFEGRYHFFLHRGFVPENKDGIGRHFHVGPQLRVAASMRGQTAAEGIGLDQEPDALIDIYGFLGRVPKMNDFGQGFVRADHMQGVFQLPAHVLNLFIQE